MAGLHLHDVAQGMALVLVPFLGFEAGEDLIGQRSAGLFGQAAAAVQFDGGAAVEEGQDRAVHDSLAKLLDHVVDQGRLAGAIGVEEAGVGVQPGKHKGPFNLAVEDAVAVVQGTVERVAGALGTPPGPVQIGQEEFADGLPVFLRPPAFDGEDLSAHVIDGIASDRVLDRFGAQPVQFGDVVEHVVSKQAYFPVQVRLFGLAVFGHVFEQVDLVIQLAFGHCQGNVQAAAVLAGLELRAARLHGCGQAGAVEAAYRFAAAAEEVDRHTFFGAGGHDVAAEAYAAPGDEDGFEVHQGRVAPFFALAGDAQAPAFFGDKAAELVYDQVLNDGHFVSSEWIVNGAVIDRCS